MAAQPSRNASPSQLRALPPLDEDSSDSDLRQAWLYLGAGVLALPLFYLSFVQTATWVLGAIAHELGHSAAGWLAGVPSIPRLMPGHYADTLMGGQSRMLALLLCVGVAGMPWRAWKCEASATIKGIALGCALLYPAVIFTGAREIVFLFAGHGFELVFAGVAFFRAFTGGFTHSNVERVAYSVCAWLLLADSVGLFAGLIFDAGARAEYMQGSPSGWPNDLLRVAEAWGVSLQAVAALSLFVAVCVPPAAIAAGLFARRQWGES